MANYTSATRLLRILGETLPSLCKTPLYTRLILVNARLIPGILAKSMDSALGKIKLEY